MKRKELKEIISGVIEEYIVSDILAEYNINESVVNSKIIEKVKTYAKKGLLTTAIVMSILPKLNAQEQNEVKDIAQNYGIEVQNNATKEVSIRVIAYAKNFSECKKLMKEKTLVEFEKLGVQSILGGGMFSGGQSANASINNGNQTLSYTPCYLIYDFIVETTNTNLDDSMTLTIR